MDAAVVAVGLDVVHLSKSISSVPPAATTGIFAAVACSAGARAQPLDDAREPLRVDGLQQVVERLDSEGVDGVLRVGGHEDDRGRRALASGAQLEAGQPRQLDVEEDGVVPLRARARRRRPRSPASPTTSTSSWAPSR